MGKAHMCTKMGRDILGRNTVEGEERIDMAYFNNEPLNNRSGIGGKEKMEREAAKKETARDEDKEERRELKEKGER